MATFPSDAGRGGRLGPRLERPGFPLGCSAAGQGRGEVLVLLVSFSSVCTGGFLETPAQGWWGRAEWEWGPQADNARGARSLPRREVAGSEPCHEGDGCGRERRHVSQPGSLLSLLPSFPSWGKPVEETLPPS